MQEFEQKLWLSFEAENDTQAEVLVNLAVEAAEKAATRAINAYLAESKAPIAENAITLASEGDPERS